MYKQLYNLDAEGNEIKTYALGGDDFSQFDDLLDGRASGKRALDIAHDQAFMARVASLEHWVPSKMSTQESCQRRATT